RVGLLFISHNLAVVRELCDRVAVLYASQIVEEGAAASVLRRPLHPYSKGLLASLPALRPAASGARLPAIGGPPAKLGTLPSGCFFPPRCPFAAPRCQTEPQTMAEWGDNGSARCWQAGVLGEWPFAEAPAIPPPATPGAPLVRAAGLRKQFA